MPFGMWTRAGTKEKCITWGAHWRYLENTTEPSMCGGYAAFLSNNSDHNGVSTASTLLLTVWVPQTIAVIPQWKQQCWPGWRVLRGCVVRWRARPRQLYAVGQFVSAADPGERSSQTLHRRMIRLRTGTTPADNYTCTVHTFSFVCS